MPTSLQELNIHRPEVAHGWPESRWREDTMDLSFLQCIRKACGKISKLALDIAHSGD